MTLANTLTVARILIVPFFFTELLSIKSPDSPHRYVALGLFFLASLTDALDGAIARLTRTRTAIGRMLDPLADKLLLLSGYLGLLFVSALTYRPPLWITVSIVFRDLVIVVGLMVIYMLNGTVRVHPNFLGKCTTAFQMTTLIAVLLEWKFSVVFWNITAALTIISCLVYIRRELKGLKSQP